MYKVASKDTARGEEDKLLSRNEYLIEMLQRKRKAIKETLESTKVFRGQRDTTIVIVTPEERQKRFLGGFDKFGVEVVIDKVEDTVYEEVKSESESESGSADS